MEGKNKKGASRKSGKASKMSAGHSPAPHQDPACGHSKCGAFCQVAYVGPTSHPRDHHILTVAGGSMQVWTAAIVVGVGIVLTGAVAYQSVQAQSAYRGAALRPSASASANTVSVTERLNQIEKLLKEVQMTCATAPAAEPAKIMKGSPTSTLPTSEQIKVPTKATSTQYEQIKATGESVSSSRP